MISFGSEAIFEVDTFVFQMWLVFLRVGATMALLPAFGEQSIPGRIKLVIALAFTVVIFPTVDMSSEAGLHVVWATEIVVGLALGALVRFFVIALQVCGTIAAQSTSLSQLMGTPGVEPVPAIGQILVVGGLALAALFGLHLRVVEYFLHSYALFPVGVLPDPERLLTVGVQQVAYTFQLGFVLASPFVVASILYNLTLGFINRAMPQLMVAFVGAPAITFGSLFLLFLSAPLLLSKWIEALHLFLLVERL